MKRHRHARRGVALPRLATLRSEGVDQVAHVAASVAGDPGLEGIGRDTVLRPSLERKHRIAVLPDADPGARVIGRDARALAYFLEGNGDSHLPAAIGVGVVVRHGAERWRQVFRGIGAVILGREGDRYQRRTSARTIFTAIEALAAKGVGDERLGLVILSPHAAGVEAVRDIARRSLADESRAALAKELLVAVADCARVERLVQGRVWMLYAVPVAATLVSA